MVEPVKFFRHLVVVYRNFTWENFPKPAYYPFSAKYIRAIPARFQVFSSLVIFV